MRSKYLLIPCFLAMLVMMSGCSSYEVTASGHPETAPSDNDLSLDVNVYFSPDNPEPSTAIDFAVPGPGWVRLEVLNATGYRVKLLLDLEVEGGMTAYWDRNNDDGESITSGIYIYRLQWEDVIYIKMVPVCLTPEECEDMIDEN